ncbi:MAG: TIGR01440 family protein [Clostridiales bacterium]|nr:TIGR01440 family protein [Clostridiales bacterium]
MEKIKKQVQEAMMYLYEKGNLQPEDLIVIGCSTSEIVGGQIGQQSAPQVGKMIAEAALETGKKLQISIGFQCCEHLNRAVCMEKKTLQKRGYIQVAAVPQPKAGGSVPAFAWKLFETPALALKVQAEGVIDIGDTFVGMHIKPVAVPVRMDNKQIGEAHLTLAYARLPYIGGQRAVYEG